MQWDVLSYGHDIAIIQAQRSEPADAAWHRSPAYRLLKQDIDDRKNEQLAPKELWMSRPEYQAFDLQCFRKHIYQEVDSRPKRAIRFEKKRKAGSTRSSIKITHAFMTNVSLVTEPLLPSRLCLRLVYR